MSELGPLDGHFGLIGEVARVDEMMVVWNSMGLTTGVRSVGDSPSMYSEIAFASSSRVPLCCRRPHRQPASAGGAGVVGCDALTLAEVSEVARRKAYVVLDGTRCKSTGSV